MEPLPARCFHLTPLRALERILAEGLVPARGPRSGLTAEARPAVFLFPSMASLETAWGSWLEDLFDEDEPLALLEVALPAGIAAERAAFEIEVHEPIPPGCLRVVDEDWGR